MRILIIGASGSGTTTLGKTLSSEYGWGHIDADDYYWLPTDPPYQKARNHEQRLKLILEKLNKYDKAIVSGSIANWGSELEESFDLVVFLYLETAIRVERLKKREEARFGSVDPSFIRWASEYDAGPSEGRSLDRHNKWLSERSCQVVRIEGDMTVEERAKIVLAALSNNSLQPMC